MTIHHQMSRFAAEHHVQEVGVDDLFFSTTDHRGVVTDFNDVFVRLSRFPAEELNGAAHNVIRHPDMPGGVFRVMWDTLHAGEPFVGYVRNRAKDGAGYDVLATVTPLPDGGFLSVRTAPTTDTFALASRLYFEMNDVEQWVINNDGVNRRDAEDVGSRRLQEELEKEGIAGYRDLMYDLLPGEVAELERRSGIGIDELGRRNAMSAAVVAVYRALDDFMAEQEAMTATVTALQAVSARLDEETETTSRVAGEMDNLRIEGPAATLLFAPLQVWANMRDIVAEYIAALQELLAVLPPLSEQARFYVALARLHALMTSQFAAGEADRSQSIRTLVAALKEGLATMSTLVAERQRVSRRVELKDGSVLNLLEIPRQMIGGWLDDTRAAELAEGTDTLVAQARESIGRSDAAMQELRVLGEALGGQRDLGFDQLRIAVGHLAEAVDGD